MTLSLFGVFRADVLGNRVGLCVLPSRVRPARFLEVARALVASGSCPDGVARWNSEPPNHLVEFMNPDESREQLCGNAAIAFGVLASRASKDGTYDGAIIPGASLRAGAGTITLEFTGIAECERGGLNTRFGFGRRLYVGTPHVVVEVRDPHSVELEDGLRASRMAGLNVTLFSETSRGIVARTFERGLPHETAACATGALAIGITHARSRPPGGRECQICYRGGVYVFRTSLSEGAAPAGLEGNGRSASVSIPASAVVLQREPEGGCA